MARQMPKYALWDIFARGGAAKQMTKQAAQQKAHALWGNSEDLRVGKIGFVRLRRKSAEGRYEVGYHEPQGARIVAVILGKGNSWERAFEDASINPEAP